MQGWIRLHRKIQDHWLYQEKRKFSKYEAWLDLLMMVNHEDKKTVLGNEMIEVKRGQRITSIRKLCDKWGWSNTKVTQFLNLLQKDGMIQLGSDSKKTVITIDNYDFYQSNEDKKTSENRRENDTKQTEKHTNKNDKELFKNENKNNIPLEIENFRLRYSKNQLKIIDDYLDMIRHTRVSAKISDTVILKMYQEWDKHPQICVEYGLKTHTENPIYHSKKENYTMGIIRNTPADEAAKKLNVGSKNNSEKIDFMALAED
ncbi:hypothetical protein [Neobacillus jeddahensis]|uniref:hypothetical protein n=1 Tax=Neobacillus jeddahensis TaxID=1461580 RepID=UPI000694539A|nr:hypothetical protein [Neobacillus jeddahensis]